MKKNIGFYGISEVKQICHVKMKKKKKTEEKESATGFYFRRFVIRITYQ